MKYTKEHKRLGLSELDVKILSQLERAGAMRPYHIVKAVMPPENRTTIEYRLKKLLQKG